MVSSRLVFTAAARRRSSEEDDDSASLPPPYDLCYPTAEKGLPLGFCFLPTDTEISEVFLKTKVLCRPLPYHEFKEGIDIYLKDPQHLPMNSVGENDKWCYFFMMRDLRYDTRTTPGGYWEVVGDEQEIVGDEDERVLAFKKHLVFRKGNGEETEWQMNEFRINPELEELKKINLHRVMANFVACKVYTHKEEVYPYKEGDVLLYNESEEEEEFEEPQSKKPRLEQQGREIL